MTGFPARNSLRFRAAGLAALSLLALLSATITPPSPHPPGPAYTSGWAVPDLPVGASTNLWYGTPPRPGERGFDPQSSPVDTGRGYSLLFGIRGYASVTSGITGVDQHTSSRFFAVEIAVSNVAPATRTVTLDPVDGVTLVADDGRNFSALPYARIANVTMLPPGQLTLRGGSGAQGWVLFAVPPSASIRLISAAPMGIYSTRANWLVCDIVHPEGCL